jgi:hypothetical protein
VERLYVEQIVTVLTGMDGLVSAWLYVARTGWPRIGSEWRVRSRLYVVRQVVLRIG